jgi:tRNA 2-thiouridine synthesizing protein A
MTECSCSEITPDVVLDCKGDCCPMPILKTKKAINNMESGQILKVLGTDVGSKKDMPSWCERTGNELLRMDEEDGVLIFYIKKK